MMEYYDHDERERKQMHHSYGSARIYRTDESGNMDDGAAEAMQADQGGDADEGKDKEDKDNARAS